MMNHFIKLLLITLMASNSIFCQPSLIFKGGIGDGYTIVEFVSSEENIMVKGGKGDGHYFVHVISLTSFYAGGNSQGYSHESINSNDELIMALGGKSDGYHMELTYAPFTWTGKVGEGWNNADNWNSLVIPDLTRKTIIPADALNWPHINAGIFAIGENPAGGAFTSAELLIEKGAQLTTRLNNVVQNYGLITIDGMMTVKSLDSNAFINYNGSILRLESNGRLIFDSN